MYNLRQIKGIIAAYGYLELGMRDSAYTELMRLTNDFYKILDIIDILENDICCRQLENLYED